MGYGNSSTAARAARSAVALLLPAWLLASPLAGQDLTAERRRVLKVVGSVKAVDLPLQPLGRGLGLVFAHDVVEPGALALRLHFRVENAQQAGASWGIQVKDGADTPVWSVWAGDVAGEGLWSDEIDGPRARVEVYSARTLSPVLLKIDKVVTRRDQATPLSITGRNDLAPIAGQDDWIVERGRSVARVRFVGDDGEAYVCTAFLVTHELLLTNQHCLATPSETESALIDFDLDSAGPPRTVLRLDQLLQTNLALDYSLVRLQRAVDRAPLRLDATRPPDREQLLIIQHPGGEPKQVSLRDCRVDGVSVPGRVAPGTDFGHQCDTEGGSSGSPVFRFDSRTVVGLHHLGISPGGSELFNRAVHVDRILADLRPAHRSEIERGQPSP